MNDNDNRKWLYETLKSSGYNMGSYDEFNNAMDNDENTRRWCYDQAVGKGINMGSYDEYTSAMRGVQQPTPAAPTAAQQQPVKPMVAAATLPSWKTSAMPDDVRKRFEQQEAQPQQQPTQEPLQPLGPERFQKQMEMQQAVGSQMQSFNNKMNAISENGKPFGKPIDALAPARQQRLQKEANDKLNESLNIATLGITQNTQPAREAWNQAGLRTQKDWRFGKLISNEASYLKNHDLDRMSEEAWNNIPTDRKQTAIRKVSQVLRGQNPELSYGEALQMAERVVRAKSDQMMYDMAVEQNAPKGWLDYLTRKINDNAIGSILEGVARHKAGTIGDMQAREEATQQYANDNWFGGLVGDVAAMTLAPEMWIGGGVAGGALKGGTAIAGRAAGKAAVREGMSTLAGRMATKGLTSGVNLATFNAIGDAAGQAKHGGKIEGVDEETGRYVIGDYSLGDVGKSALHGLGLGVVTGPTGELIGNVGTKLVNRTASTAGKAAIRGSQALASTVAEGTIFVAPEILSGDITFDDWKHSVEMMAAFKLQGGLKSAKERIAELRGKRENSRQGFETRLRTMLDKSPNLALTKDEKAELERGGYKDLADLVEGYKKATPDQRKAIETRQPIYLEPNENGEIPLNRFIDLVEDKNISEAARAKMYYYVTGHGLPQHTIVGSNFTEHTDDKGNTTYNVQSFSRDNGIVTSRTFTNKKEAENELARINRQAELNGVDMGEKHYNELGDAERMKDAYDIVAEQKGISGEALRRKLNRRPEEMDATEKAWAKEVQQAYDNLPQDAYKTSDDVRKAINSEYDVDVDDVLKKERARRTEKEQEALEEYTKRLFADVMPKEGQPNGTNDATRLLEGSGYDGVLQRISDDADMMAAEQREEAKKKQFRGEGENNGALRPMKINVTGVGVRDVYLTQGEIVLTDSGLVDPEKTKEVNNVGTLTGYDPATGEEVQFTPADIVEVEPMTTAEQQEQNIEANKQAYIQQQMDAATPTATTAEPKATTSATTADNQQQEPAPAKPKGEPKEFVPGMTLTVTDRDGNEHSVTTDGERYTYNPVTGELTESENGNYLKLTDEEGNVMSYDLSGKGYGSAQEIKDYEMPKEEQPTETVEPTEPPTAEVPTAEGITPQQQVTPESTPEPAPVEEADPMKAPMPMRTVTTGKGKNAKTETVPDFYAVPAEKTFDYIYNELGFTPEIADATVKANADETAKTINEHKAKEPQPMANPIAYKEAHDAWQRDLDAMNQQADYWKKVQSIRNQQLLAEAEERDKATRAERERRQKEIEASRKRDEEAYQAELSRRKAERDKKMEASLNAMMQMSEDAAPMEQMAKEFPIEQDAEAMEIMNDRSPRTLEEVAAWMLSDTKDTENKIDPELVREHTGYGTTDLNKFPFIFKKGGMSPEAFGEKVEQTARENDVVFKDNENGFSALLNVLGEVGGLGDLKNYIKENHRKLAEKVHSDRLIEAVARQAEDKSMQQNSGMNDKQQDNYMASMEQAVESGVTMMTDEETEALFSDDAVDPFESKEENQKTNSNDTRTETNDEGGDQRGAEKGGADESEAGQAGVAADDKRGDIQLEGEPQPAEHPAGEVAEEAPEKGASPIGNQTDTPISNQGEGSIENRTKDRMEQLTTRWRNIFRHNTPNPIEDIDKAIEEQNKTIDAINNGQTKAGPFDLMPKEHYEDNKRELEELKALVEQYGLPEIKEPVVKTEGADKPLQKFSDVKKFMQSIGYKGSMSNTMTSSSTGKKIVKYYANGVVTPTITLGETTPRDIWRQFHLYGNIMDVEIPTDIKADLDKEREEYRKVQDELQASDIERTKKILTEAGIPFTDVIDSERGIRIVFTDRKNDNGNYVDYTDYADAEQVRDSLNFIRAKAEKMQPKQQKTGGEVKEALIKGKKWEKTGEPAPYKSSKKGDNYDTYYQIGKKRYGLTIADADTEDLLLKDYGTHEAIWNAYERGQVLLSPELAAAIKAKIEYMESTTPKQQKTGGEATKTSERDRSLLEVVMDKLRNIIGDRLHTTLTEDEKGLINWANAKTKGTAPVFYSNAERAVEGIKQEKATAEQWLAMIQKAGGLKAGEDKWMGLSEWLNDHKGKSLTKQEVLDYIRDNQIQMEEVNYGDALFSPNSKVNFESDIERARENGESDESVMEAWDREFDTKMVEAYKNGEFTIDENGKVVYDGQLMMPINDTRRRYTTDFLKNKREIAFVIPNVESWNRYDDVHFGDAGEGRAVMWVRFGETTDNDGKKVLVIDEIQSNRHQEGREKGYRKESTSELIKKQGELERRRIDMVREFQKNHPDDVNNEAWDAFVNSKEYKDILKEESETEDKIRASYNLIPDAPFEKNWHEVAMKRMLRYAAENGYDKVAWTTGEQQADRYDIGAVAKRLVITEDGDNYTIKAQQNDGTSIRQWDNVPKSELPNYVGKDIAAKVESGENLYSKNGQSAHIFTGQDLRIGAEGMKGFYDQILPRFMDKYGKKWGVKTTDVELPNIGDNGLTMHSVEVTPEMKKSVLEGQPMFHKVFHGSGADFERFDSSHMGEGEGAQAYGYGHYTTEVEGIGRTYAKAMGQYEYQGRKYNDIRDNWKGDDATQRVVLDVLKYLDKDNDTRSVQEAIDFSIKVKELRIARKIGDVEEAKRELDALKNLSVEDFKTSATLYTVEIPDDNGSNYLTWNKTLPKAQRRRIADAVRGLEGEPSESVKYPKYTGGWQQLADMIERNQWAYQEVRDRLVQAFGGRIADEKRVSDLMHEAGFVGVKYPAEFRSGGREDGAKNYVIFDDGDLKIIDKVKFFKTPQGEVYGFTVGGNIYVDMDIAKADTPIHEYGHLWVPMVRESDPEMWEDIKRVLTKDKDVKPFMDIVRQRYTELTAEGREDDFMEEVFTHFSGDNGLKMLEEAAREYEEKDGNGIISKAKAIAALNKVKEALDKFWGKVAQLFGIKFRNAREVANKMFKDFMDEVDPTKVREEQSKARDKEYMEAVVKGDRKTERQMVAEAAEQSMPNSKIRGKDGKLLVVYHDTNSTRWVNKETGEEWDKLDWQARDEWEERDDWDEHWEERPFYTFDNETHGRQSVEVPGFFFHAQRDEHHEYGNREIAAYVNITNPIINPEIPNRGVTNTAGRDAMNQWMAEGYDGMIRTDEEGNWIEVVAFSPEQIKSADPVTYDDNGNVIPLSKRFNSRNADIRFQKADNKSTERESDGTLFRSLNPESDEVVDNAEVGTKPLSDREKVAKLEAEPKVKVYRSMQLIDGKLYPPMSAKVDGQLREPSELGVWEEADEAPDMADDNGKFKLDKGNRKSLKAAYNPYIHTSRTMLNDQFSEAQDRPNLVVVEMEVPESELTSGYKAEKAKDSVGAKQWKAGVIQGQLSGTREVILSRWAKPVRIVPAEEVAENIARQIEGQVKVMPSNVVTPEVRAALEAKGVKFVETDNTGKIKEGPNKGKTWASVYGKKEQAKRDAVNRLGKRFGVDIEVVENPDDIQHSSPSEQEKMRKAPGFYRLGSGKVVIVLPNNRDASDVVSTVMHEVLTHKGLREVIGEDNMPAFLDEIYSHLTDELKKRVDTKMTQEFINDMRSIDHARRVATEEMIADISEKMPEEMTENERSLWQKVCDWIRNAIDKLFTELKLPKGYKVTENDIRYMIWKTRQHMEGRKPDYVEMAQDVNKRNELGLDEENLYRDQNNAVDDVPRAAAREAYERMIASGANQFKEAVQDSMLSLKKLYEAILGKGTKIEDVEGYKNAYLAENRMHSASQAEIGMWHKDFMEPVVKAIHELTGGKRAAYDDLVKYMMAKHGLERNAVFAERDAQAAAKKGADYDDELQKNRGRDYAGLTALTGEDDVANAEGMAQKMVDDYEADHDTTELWNAINRATKQSLWKLASSGMMTPERYNEIRDMFSYYIPLQGFDETVAENVYSYMGNDGTIGYGTPIRHARGRKSLADDPIATMAMNGEAAIRQANRNEMKKRFLAFAQEHPSDLVSVSEVWLKHNDVTGEWEQVTADLNENDSPADVERKTREFDEKMEQLASNDPDHYKKASDIPNVPFRVVEPSDMKQHQVLVQRGGKKYMLTINGNPRAAQALNGLTNPDVFTEGVFGKAMNLGQWLNRQLSAFYTTRNPEFVLSNFLRDAIYSNSMSWVKESPNYALKFHKNFGKMNPVHMGKLFAQWENGKLRERIKNGTASETDQLFYDFMTNGGETGWTSLRDIEKHKKELQSSLKREGSTSRKAWKALGEAFDLMNRSVENCARFAAFVTSREMGRSIDRSISDAKEVSVNFNKKGAGDKFLTAKNQNLLGKVGASMGGLGRGLYVFFNASMQGLNNIARATKRHPGKAAGVYSTLFALGALAPILAEVLSGGDDDDDKNAYYNLPEYIRRSNICFRFGKDMPWITIPLPIEFRAIYGLGELSTGALTGKEHYTDEEFAKQYVSQLSQVLPLDFMEGGGGWHAFVPSMIKPYVEAQSNTSWTGLPIYRDNTFKPYDPEWTRAYSSANKQLVDATKWLNEATGGDDVTKGFIDWNPAKIEYMLKGYLGGYFTMYDRLQKTAETALGNRDFEWRNIPMASRVLREGDERTEARKLTNEYFDLVDEYNDTKHKVKEYEKISKSDREDAIKYAQKLAYLNNSEEYTRYLLMEYYKPILDQFHDMVKEADGEQSKRIKGEENALRRELINIIHSIDDGAEIDVDAAIDEMLMGILNDEQSDISLRKKAQNTIKKHRKAMAASQQ